MVMNGYEVKVANDGVEGITLFKSCDPDLVLLDIMLLKKQVKTKIITATIQLLEKVMLFIEKLIILHKTFIQKITLKSSTS